MKILGGVTLQMANDLEERKENFIKRLKYEKDDEFELLGEFSKLREYALFKHKKCGYIWRTKPVTLIRSKEGLGCPHCQYKEKSSTTQKFKKDLYKVHGEEYSLAEGEEYINNRSKLNIVHNKCNNTFEVSPVSILKNNSCPFCKLPSKKKRTRKEFEEKLYEQHGDEYILSQYSDYIEANEKVSIIHTSCGYEWTVRAAHILYRSGCPKCRESKGENFVSSILNELKINFKREYTFNDCYNYKKLPFDFALFDVNYNLVGIIEYDGIQHFKPFMGKVKKFKQTQRNDLIKDEYCKNKSIKLLRIPYTEEKNNIRSLIEKFIDKK